ncbi:MAG: GNAT family N-acetyltransferase [Chloroflexi bacterium]|nr:GNAT family N-acetyltransferase [Ktedonobacteraceae bacterium]MBV8822686.1 GNAT family N-acetyltransferase [Ktedonobacteraceae bacterium]MBV9020570.1 GNAT family N-acetyltransferase [Ktedonobacteraceae bacterium]MBV9707299.1 GNAT family N-acetyltransferase [Chloroflexota bacterium]
MSEQGKMPVTIRQARSEDIGSILDLLTEYDLPRSYFEPFYLNDSSYRPEQSWVVEQDGRLVAHLRVFDRWIRIDRAHVHIAGIGNAITAKDARGHGYSSQLMTAMLPALQQAGYAYSLLWTHLPSLYGRHGWIPIEQELMRGSFPPFVGDTVIIAPFQEQDLPAVMELYERTNARRTGTTIRSTEYWQDQLLWLHEDHSTFLVARDKLYSALVGYVRSREGQQAVEILELGIAAGSATVGHALLSAVATEHHSQLRGQFPPSQSDVFVPGTFEAVHEPGLMGRVVNLAELFHALEGLWMDRLQQANTSEGILSVSTSAGLSTWYVRNGKLQREEQHNPKRVPPLHERELAHLLFHGFDTSAHKLVGHRSDVSFLQTLFPVQDFVIWQADAF